METSKDRLITLVVHTRSRAMRLRDILTFHNIPVVLEELEIEDSESISPVKVRIPLEKLSLGLKILESGDLSVGPLSMIKMTGKSNHLLIPVDFTERSMAGVRIGFYLAEKFGIEPVLLHSYVAPLYSAQTDIFDEMTEMEETALEGEEIDLRKIAAERLSKFKNEVLKRQKNGDLPDIKFSTTLLEGVPEQVILEYARMNNPLMIVMMTRSLDKKGADLVGSVTAEVLDSCRVPVLAIPENFPLKGSDAVKKIAIFCSQTSFDIVTVKGLMKMFDYPSCEVFLLPLEERNWEKMQGSLNDMKAYFSDAFPTATFKVLNGKNLKNKDGYRDILENNDIEMIIVPNKKSNALSRFFRPTLAHKLLFERDVPLLALPI